jgi:hypothetical protein
MGLNRPHAIALTAVLAATLLACGGPMTPGELSRSVDTLSSTSAEGALIARDVARDRTKATFARVRARELADVADHEAEKLADATPSEGIGGRKAQAVQLAGDISQALGEISVHPSDEAAARAAAEKLDGLADRTERLSRNL